VVFLGAAVVIVGIIVVVGRTEELDDGLTAMVDADEVGVADTDGITIDVLLTIAFPETVELGVAATDDDDGCAVVRPMVATKTTKQEIQFISIFIFYNFTFENISLALIKMRYNVQRPPFFIFFLKNMTRKISAKRHYLID